MKRHGNLFEAIVHPDNLCMAYTNARRGKRWQNVVKDFEKDIEGNLARLHKMLRAKEFTTSAYRSKTIHEPKTREIYILPFFPDRIVQHALIHVLGPIWDNLMINDSYACRKGKGMHRGSRRVMNHVRRYKYCLKGDMSKFYPSIDHDILMEIIERKIKCKDTLWLLEDIVRSFEGGRNTPIGNYTSQWFGNLYLNELDTQIKQTHKQKAYIRYCDDFVLFGDSKPHLHALKEWIEKYLCERLKLAFSKWSIFPVTQGVDFIGYRHFKKYILLRKSTSKRVKKRLQRMPSLLKSGRITIEQYRSSLASTRGWLKWANTHNLSINLQLDKLDELCNAT